MRGGGGELLKIGFGLHHTEAVMNLKRGLRAGPESAWSLSAV